MPSRFSARLMRLASKIVLGLVCGWLLAGCALLPSPTPSPFPTSPPPPTLQPAGPFEVGVSRAPTGRYLFLRLASDWDCSPACACPVIEPPRTSYSFSDRRELRVELYPPNVPADWDPDAARLDTLGFLAYGRWGEQVYLLDSLPYTTPDGRIVIQAIDAQGGVVVALDGQTGLIPAGQRWLESSRSPRATPPGCIMTSWYQLVNDGLLERSQITVVK